MQKKQGNGKINGLNPCCNGIYLIINEGPFVTEFKES